MLPQDHRNITENDQFIISFSWTLVHGRHVTGLEPDDTNPTDPFNRLPFRQTFELQRLQDTRRGHFSKLRADSTTRVFYDIVLAWARASGQPERRT